MFDVCADLANFFDGLIWFNYSLSSLVVICRDNSYLNIDNALLCIVSW